jgi:hypothetical protein
MKKIAILALLAIVSCNQDDSPIDPNGSVAFAVNAGGPEAGKNVSLIPEKLVVSVEDINGKTIFDNKVVTLVQTSRGYTTEGFQLASGDYRVTKYLVISGTEATYAAPKSGAQKASLVDRPLPFDFTVVASRESTVTPTLVGISSEDTPQIFGYGDFGYSTPGESQEWISVRVKLEVIVGDIYYPNVDGAYTVHAFDESNTEVWTEDFDYVGPGANDLRIQNGFDHYTIEAKKWGTTSQQVYSRASLHEVRVSEGEVPVTQVFQIKVQPKRVSSTVSSWTHIANGQTITEPNSKTEYEYTDRRISGIKSYVWAADSKSFVIQTTSEFLFVGNKLQQIVTRDASDPSNHLEDNYTYTAEGNLSHIQHKPTGGVTVDVDLVYSDGGRSTRAVYKFSNGSSFEYELLTQFGSNRSDKTTRYGELCSTGSYTYDKNVNPLAHMEYTDYLFRNYSISNRITENVDYIGCAFPSLVAESYAYDYDEDGYPLRQETRYKSTSVKSSVEYTYLTGN